jgi:hypothetical protein
MPPAIERTFVKPMACSTSAANALRPPLAQCRMMAHCSHAGSGRDQ